MIEKFDDMVFLQAELSSKDKIAVINYFNECYYDTDQDTDVFAKEFFYVVDSAINGQIRLNPEYLTDFIPGLCDLLEGYPEEQKELEDYFRETQTTGQ